MSISYSASCNEDYLLETSILLREISEGVSKLEETVKNDPALLNLVGLPPKVEELKNLGPMAFKGHDVGYAEFISLEEKYKEKGMHGLAAILVYYRSHFHERRWGRDRAEECIDEAIELCKKEDYLGYNELANEIAKKAGFPEKKFTTNRYDY